MNSREQLLTLCNSLSLHDGVTHWAISSRIFGKGDFFARLKGCTPRFGRPRSCSMASYERAMAWFSAHWPDGLDWPEGVPRSTSKRREVA